MEDHARPRAEIGDTPRPDGRTPRPGITAMKGVLGRFRASKDGSNDNDRILIPILEHPLTREKAAGDTSYAYEVARNYYAAVRQEIEREDEITYKRIHLTLTCQGFMIALFGLLVNAFLADLGRASPVVAGGRLLLAGLTAIPGFFLALVCFRGVDASRRSLRWAKDQWIAFNRINGHPYPSLFPQPTKRANRHSCDRVENNRLVQLTQSDFSAETYVTNASPLRAYRDAGWDFSLAIPLVLCAFWCLALAGAGAGLVLLVQGQI